jgi:fructan beta-fructosidase
MFSGIISHGCLVINHHTSYLPCDQPAAFAEHMRPILLLILAFVMFACRTKDRGSPPLRYAEQHRPQLHFTPPAKWMNDPNGMIYIDGTYHLFYQHYPDSTVWGPMHWGHAVSEDLIHWDHKPIALYPDSLGMIFSGSAVYDENNTSGLGTSQNPPLVAIFTYHFAEGEKAGRIDYQTQGLAYSLDKGKTWKKYKQNPVLLNPGIKDFRDPKVFWHAGSKSWIMTLAVSDHVELFGSPNLIHWKKLSEFGKEYGSHGGVWECPDLFELTAEDDAVEKWVLLLSINPGGPNGGSGTQYFIGDFDGQIFRADNQTRNPLWIDYGPDNYAGVTWSNIPQNDRRRIFIGWMSNWAYANLVPTSPWRSAMTLPRQLKLKKVNNEYRVSSEPIAELRKLVSETKLIRPSTIEAMEFFGSKDENATQWFIQGKVAAEDFSFELSNDENERVRVSFNKLKRKFLLDRMNSGVVDFSTDFATLSEAPRLSQSDTISITMVIDVSSLEVFFDDGVTNMTALFFPGEKLNKLALKSPSSLNQYGFEVRKLQSIW